MPRQVRISLPSDRTDEILKELNGIEGILGVRVQRGASIKPPGDLIEVDVINRKLGDLSHMLDRYEIGMNPQNSISSSLPASLVSSGSVHDIANDTSESSWEEMELTLGRESNMTLNSIAVMAVSGFICIVGIGTGSIHLVIAAMVIAPGFEPFTRISLGVVLKSAAWKRGLSGILKGYAALLTGAAAAALLLSATGQDIFSGPGSFISKDSLVMYWTTVHLSSVSVSAAASLAGAVLIAAHRSVLTAGVMIALALIPSASLIGAGLVTQNPPIALNALLRFAV